jgi:hypothetical protein
MANNQTAFDMTLKRMQGLSRLSKRNIDESTGGDSFCYVNITTTREGLIPMLVQKGAYPLFQVDLVITDQDAADAALKVGAGADINSFRHGFPRIDFLTRASLFHPLGVYSVKPTESYKHYLVEMYARNRGFTELLRVSRVKEGGWTKALIVSASYFTGVKGIVLEQVDGRFPRTVLDGDHDWQNFKKLKVLKVKE